MMKLTQIAFFTSLITCSILNARTVLDFDESLVRPPLVDSNEEMLLSTTCRTRDHLRWDVCYSKISQDEIQMKSFKFSNTGENEIVPNTGFGIGRDFEFMFEGFARSDLGLLIWDSPDEYESHAHLKLMMFFPRIVLPAVRYFSNSEQDLVIVTLPTKEEVIFNGKSKEIISGVMKEGPIKQDSEGNALKPDVTYTGKGVVVEADSLADYPVGLTAQTRSKYATIKKSGHNDCKIPVKDLWYTDQKKGGNVFFNKKYITDENFDKLLKQKCKFSLY